MRLFPRYSGAPLIDQIVSVENLTLAWRRVRSNIKLAQRGRSSGPDAVTLRDFEHDWARHMGTLADELRNGSYRPVPPKRISIPKASGGQRAIAILTVRDRVAQRAVQQVLEPLFDPFFLDCAYGCRPGLGVPQAIERVQRYADQGLTWVVDADISNYFESIDQRIVLGLVRQRIDDGAVMRLIAQWLSTGTIDQSDVQPLHSPTTMLGRAGEAVQRFFDHDDHRAHDIYDDPRMGESMWPSDHADMWGQGSALASHGGGIEQKLWTAAMVARPVVRGVRMALPYAQRLGTRRLAVAGAVAASALAAGEVLVRQQARRRGTPQGGALSPLLANIYLHPFDVALTNHGVRIVRFMDDFVLMCRTSEDAYSAYALAERQLHALRLTMNAEKTHVLPYSDGLDFLGHALVPRQHGPRLGQGVRTFSETEHALRTAADQVRSSFKRRR